MFSFLNAVQVIPVSATNFVQQTLAHGEIRVPVLLKAHQEQAGWLTLCGWVPGEEEPVCRHVATEMLVCISERKKLQAVLEEFCAEIKSRESRGRMAFLDGLVAEVGGR